MGLLVRPAGPPKLRTGSNSSRRREDSISTKKIRRGDACFTQEKEMLGMRLIGAPSEGRVVGLTEEKKDKYVDAVQKALASLAY